MPIDEAKRQEYRDELESELAHINAGTEDDRPGNAPKRPPSTPRPPPPVIPGG